MPDSTKRGPDRGRLPVRTANTSLPAIGETPRRTQARQELAPADEAIEPFDIAALSTQAKAIEDIDPWRWPRLPGLSRDRINELESTVEDLRKELAERCVQIADLRNIQQQQATALLVARDAIEALQNSASVLQESIAQRESEIEVARQELQSSFHEKTMLSEKLVDTEKETAALLQKLLHLSTALNDKEVAVIAAEERVAKLEQELNAKSAQETATQNAAKQHESAQDEMVQDEIALRASAQDEAVQNEAFQTATTQDLTKQDATAQALVPVPASATESGQTQLYDENNEQTMRFENLLHRFESMLAVGGERLNKLDETHAKLSARCDALDQSHAQLERQIKKLENLLAARERQVHQLSETNNKLSERCDELARNNIILEAGNKHAQEKIKSQSNDIKLLEVALRTGRETAEQKIADLTGELQREREVHTVAERESAAIRREIALLLSKLTIAPRSIQ